MMGNEVKFKRQVEFFKLIKNFIPNNSILVHEVSELLKMSTDSAYRRINGKSPLEFEEAMRLCEHFNFSFDCSVGDYSNHAKCLYTPMDINEKKNLMTYTNNLTHSLGKIRSSPENEILLSASCIPFFCLGGFKDLVLFLFYSWNKNVYGASGGYEKFTSNSETEELLKCYETISDLYMQTPSVEIWSTKTVDSFLSLLVFHYTTGAFNNNMIPIHLCNQLLQVMEMIQLWTEKGEKNPDSSFRFFVREVGIENTFVLFKHPKETFCLVKLFTVNSLIISDSRFCIEMEGWLRNLSQQATLISEGSAVERYDFFTTQRKKITDFMK